MFERIYLDDLISNDQIDIVKSIIAKGDKINFQRDGVKIKGVVKNVYANIFVLEDGRSFTWIEFIIGSPDILHYLKLFHPNERLNIDKTPNYYNMKMIRVD